MSLKQTRIHIQFLFVILYQMLGKKFNIRQMEMNEQMREVILDQVRRVIENSVNATEQTIELKNKLQQIFGGQWQIIIGEGQIAGYFNVSKVQNYIQLSTESKTMLIFRKVNKPLEQSDLM